MVGGEVTCVGEMVGGESYWWRDDWIPSHLTLTLLRTTVLFF